MNQLRSRLIYSNVMATIAVVTRRRAGQKAALLAVLAGLAALAVPASAAAANQSVFEDLTQQEAENLRIFAGAPGGATYARNSANGVDARLFAFEPSGNFGCRSTVAGRCLMWQTLEEPNNAIVAPECASVSTAIVTCAPPADHDVSGTHLRLVDLSFARPYTIDLGLSEDIRGNEENKALIANVFPALTAGVVYGGGATDRIVTQSDSRDVLLGMDGDDGLQIGRAIGEGGPRNFLSGGSGNDTVSAFRNGAPDTVICGGGSDDRGFVDLTDRDSRGGQSFSDCESRFLAPMDQHPLVSVTQSKVRVKGGRARVRLRCPKQATSRCEGRLLIKRGKRGERTLGRARYEIRKGGKDTVRVRVKRGLGTARAIARETGPDGRPKISVHQIKLRR